MNSDDYVTNLVAVILPETEKAKKKKEAQRKKLKERLYDGKDLFGRPIKKSK